MTKRELVIPAVVLVAGAALTWVLRDYISNLTDAPAPSVRQGNETVLAQAHSPHSGAFDINWPDRSAPQVRNSGRRKPPAPAADMFVDGQLVSPPDDSTPDNHMYDDCDSLPDTASDDCVKQIDDHVTALEEACQVYADDDNDTGLWEACYHAADRNQPYPLPPAKQSSK